MAKARPSVQKRAKELQKLEKKQDKEARRAQRETDRAGRPDRTEEYDPDIAGIVPGPQPDREGAV